MLEYFWIRPEEENQPLEVSAIVTELEKLPAVVTLPGDRYSFLNREPIPEKVYIVCEGEEQAGRIRDWTSQGNPLDRFIGLFVHLEVGPELIRVYQEAPLGAIQLVASLLVPFLKAGSYRIFSEYAEETGKYSDQPELLFDPMH